MKDFRLECFCFLLSCISKIIHTCSVMTLLLTDYSDRTRHIRTIQQKVLLTIELLTVTASVLIGFPVNLATFSYKVSYYLILLAR